MVGVEVTVRLGLAVGVPNTVKGENIRPWLGISAPFMHKFEGAVGYDGKGTSFRPKLYWLALASSRS